MTGFEIGLLVIGAVLFIGSFFVSEKLSSSDMSEIEGLSEEQIKVLLEKKLNDAESKIDSSIDDIFSERKEEFENGADKETNERIMSIGEYADSVFKSMDKTHQEILFLYQMLNDKQESITQMTKTLGEAESHVRELLAESGRQTVANTTSVFPAPVSADDSKASDKPFRNEASSDEPHEESSDTDEESKETIEEEVSSEKDTLIQADDAEEAEDKQAVKDKVLSMYHQGYTELEIAKETGKGMGEIQMILDLFDEKEDE